MRQTGYGKNDPLAGGPGFVTVLSREVHHGGQSNPVSPLTTLIGPDSSNSFPATRLLQDIWLDPGGGTSPASGRSGPAVSARNAICD